MIALFFFHTNNRKYDRSQNFCLAENYELFVNTPSIQNRTGRWYLTVMALNQSMSKEELLNKTPIARENIVEFKSDYSLRTWTTGCYFYHEGERAWIANGTGVKK